MTQNQLSALINQTHVTGVRKVGETSHVIEFDNGHVRPATDVERIIFSGLLRAGM